MALSMAFIVLAGLLLNYIFTKLKLPGFLGMIILGVAAGPYGFNFLDKNLIEISGDLRTIALIIILLRAGLGISRSELKKVGTIALKFTCIPGLIEGFTVAFVSMKLLGFSFIEGGMLGFIIAAVSPAVVVPFMIFLTENKIGTEKGIPTIILAGASADDVFAITLFTVFLGLYGGSSANPFLQVLGIPLSIILGTAVGIITGIILVRVFKKFHIRDTKKVLIILSISIFLKGMENFLQDKIEIASLIGVMTIGFIILEKLPAVAGRLSGKFNKIWVFAEILLFVLVGAQVNVHVAIDAGMTGIVIILAGLAGRSIGGYIATIGSNLNMKERLFCILAYIPKATVQAAIGGIPLAAGVASGDVILAIAVLSIIITAPAGAVLMKLSYKNLLE
ncbi:sodium:proton antiporter [Sebaldella sp. S0638]|uniref:cation:proton antiporter n=1 Tax=Sebaldella sp. S0638 TaxID=2957809 RepID=UPI00209DA85A|nr:cation:proton antiporter [Sebaldella sp. S0638]MCP1224188.1 cation:proton antiporter [Sebaldella sp. S0638]